MLRSYERRAIGIWKGYKREDGRYQNFVGKC